MLKQLFILIILVLLSFPVFAQQVDTAWVRRYSGPVNMDDIPNIVVDGSGNVFLAGESYDTGVFSDYATIKYDKEGNQLWERKYNGPGNFFDYANAIAMDHSGNVYVTGSSGGDYATIKYDTDGNQLWVQRYNGPGNSSDIAHAIALDDSGSVYVTGESRGSGSDYDYATIKYTPNGDTAWVRRYVGPGGYPAWDNAYAIVMDHSGNVYVTGGSVDSGDTFYACCTIKYDSGGNQLWVKRYNGPGYNWDKPHGIALDDSGNVYVTAESYGSGSDNDYATIKYDPQGNQLWVQRYNGPGNDYDYAAGIAIDNSGNIYVTGLSMGSGTYYDYATIKYDSQGNQVWVRRYNGPANSIDEANAIAVDGFGNVYVAGTSVSVEPNPDYTTIKYDTDGSLKWVKRYIGPPVNHDDEATDIVVDSSKNIYVTGVSASQSGGYDYATIKYVELLDINFTGIPGSGFKPLPVQFTDLSSGNPTSWHWDFGDGNTDTVQNPIHIYSDTGHFDVRLIASNPTRSDTLIKLNSIAVYDTLSVDFSGTPIRGRKPLTVSFQNLCSLTPDSVTWYFGDGQTSYQLNPVHKYTEFGNYDVKLVAELFGYKDSVIKEEYIKVSDIKAEFSADKRCGSSPLTVTFNDSSSGSYPITYWHWDFGDGDTSNLQNPTHQFTETKVFDITLIVSDSIGADSLIKRGYITTQDSISADLVGLPNSGRSPLIVMFEPFLNGIANHYFWEFGDGDTSSSRNPIHVYSSQDKYDVKLRIRLDLDDCLQEDSIIKEDYIIVNDLQAEFSANPASGVEPLIVQFTDSSTGNQDTWFWDFGDGNTSTQQNPQHQYDTAGIYNVFLRVSNYLGVDSLLKLEYVRVDTPFADIFGEIYAWPQARPGFNLCYYFVWTNIGTIPAENCTLKIVLPSKITFDTVYLGDIITGTYSGYSFAGDTILIPLATINPSDWYGGYIYADGNLLENILIGEILNCEMWLSTSSPDVNYDNNYVLHQQTVVGSWDPNDKLASPEGEGTSKAIEPDQRLAYTIQFENKAEATAKAIYIRVVDTLSKNLDWGTLALGASSHPDKCDYEFNPYTGEIIWFCDSIMLPPNVNPPEGEGYFTYSISPKKGLPDETAIANTAWIRFDYNEWLRAPVDGPVIRTIKHPYIRGDANGDSKKTVSDAVYLINYLFKGGPLPIPVLQAGDCNCDEKVTVADVVYLINYLFKGGPPPCS